MLANERNLLKVWSVSIIQRLSPKVKTLNVIKVIKWKVSMNVTNINARTLARTVSPVTSVGFRKGGGRVEAGGRPGGGGGGGRGGTPSHPSYHVAAQQETTGKIKEM